MIFEQVRDPPSLCFSSAQTLWERTRERYQALFLKVSSACWGAACPHID